MTILIVKVDSTSRFDRIIQALIQLGAEVHLGNWRRWNEWLVAEEPLEIVELVNDFFASGTDIGCIDLRHRCTQRNVIGGVTIFHVKGWSVKNLAVENVVGEVNHAFHFLEERKSKDDVDCDIRSRCDTEGAVFAVRLLVRKKELECSVEIRRDRMRLVGDNASKSDFGMLLGAIFCRCSGDTAWPGPGGS